MIRNFRKRAVNSNTSILYGPLIGGFWCYYKIKISLQKLITHMDKNNQRTENIFNYLRSQNCEWNFRLFQTTNDNNNNNNKLSNVRRKQAT